MTEKRTGNINFGASVGQGTGLGGFLGLEEPNLFGRGKRGRLQWQFGRNINDFTLSYSDPAINESRISGTVSVYNSRQRFVIGDLGRRQQEGGSVQLGLPLLGSRYTRVFASYGFQRIRYTEGSADIQAQFQCAPCSRSTLGLSVIRDVRVGLPFPVAGSLASVGVEQNGGPLGGTGDYQKVDLDTRWYAPIGVAGGGGQVGSGVQFTLGLSAKSGFIFGNPGGSSRNSIRWAAYNMVSRCAAMTSSRSRPTGTMHSPVPNGPAPAPLARPTLRSRSRPAPDSRSRST